jgi:hypothetical protein
MITIYDGIPAYGQSPDTMTNAQLLEEIVGASRIGDYILRRLNSDKPSCIPATGTAAIADYFLGTGELQPLINEARTRTANGHGEIQRFLNVVDAAITASPFRWEREEDRFICIIPTLLRHQSIRPYIKRPINGLSAGLLMSASYG